MKQINFQAFSSLILGLFLLITLNSSAQSEAELNKNQVLEWYKGRSWLNGLQLKPDKSVNQQQFAKEYFSNKLWWDEAFEFLRTHDLDSIKPGFYKIDGNNVFAMVSDGTPEEIGQIKWESHRRFNDLQYVARGKVKMGVVSINKASVNEPYNDQKDIAHYSVAHPKYFIAQPGNFFIFSPADVHRAAIRIQGIDSVKRIIIKVGTGK